jgi:hypothetical protein
MIENYFVMLVTRLKSLVGNIVSMTHAIFKIETKHGPSIVRMEHFLYRQCFRGGISRPLSSTTAYPVLIKEIKNEIHRMSF